MSETRVGLAEITKHFQELKDPRVDINVKHPFVSVLVIALLAVLAGANGPTAIAKWAQSQKAFLLTVLDLPNGLPGKDVFRYVLHLVNPQAFQACFAAWLQALREAAAAETEIDQPIFNVDGKSLRRSHDHQHGLGVLHSVSLWASEFGLSLGQVACAEKSNEITAIPELLRLVNVAGAIITIDAMGTQKDIAAQIVEQEADYVLALKGNQPTLHQAVVEYIDKQSENNFAGCDARRHETTEKGHGRVETRQYVHLSVPDDLAHRDLWKGLQTIGRATTVCVRNGQETVETRYFISSLPVGVKRFARAVRSHWGIENSCHWTLDMTFREDESRIRDEHLRENMAWLNRFVLSLLKQHPSKDSIAMKRRCCGWSTDFLLEVLTGIRT